MTTFWNQPLRPNTSRDFYLGMAVLAFTVVFILILFQPFGTASFQLSGKYLFLTGYGIVILLSAGTFYEVASRLATNWMNSKPWTLKKELTFLAPLLLFSISATYLYHFVMLGGRISIFGYLFYVGLAMATSLFPLALILTSRILGSRAWAAQTALTEVRNEERAQLTLHGENSQDIFTCWQDELVYLQASDNYVECFLAKSGELQRQVLRTTLKDMESQLDGLLFLRVHRSYIVNLEHVLELEGRSPNYQVKLRPPELLIPVSRQRVRILRAYLANRPK